MDNSKIIIGKIGAAHGVRGEFRVTPLTDFPDRFDNLKHVFIDSKNFEVESRRQNGKFIILKLKGIEDRDSAQSLNGKFLTVDRSEVPPINDDEFYVFDLIGLPVIDENQNRIGIVEDVIKGYSNDNLSIRAEDGREILIQSLRKVDISIILSFYLSIFLSITKG